MVKYILIDKTDLDLLTLRSTCSDKNHLGKIPYSDWIHKNRYYELGKNYVDTIHRYYD